MNDSSVESENQSEPRRYADPYRFDRPETAYLRFVCRDFEDARKLLVACKQRSSPLADALEPVAAQARRRVEKALRDHPVWPFLEPLPGLRGALAGIVIAAIGNPHRFPGQRCSDGHYLPVGVAAVGERCPLRTIPAASQTESENRAGGDALLAADGEDGSDHRLGGEQCPGVVLPPRLGTGVRSVWHLLGLHATDDGHSPRKTRGQLADWNPEARAALLEPDTGLAAQIVRQRTPGYRDIYDQTKARLETERPDAKPISRERIARKVAIKAFVGDLLIYWKDCA